MQVYGLYGCLFVITEYLIFKTFHTSLINAYNALHTSLSSLLGWAITLINIDFEV